MIFMLGIWEASIHDDEVCTLDFLIVLLVIFDPSCPARNLFPRVSMNMETFRAAIHPILHLGTVEVVIYPSNKYLPDKFLFVVILWSESIHSNKIKNGVCQLFEW